MTRPFDPVELMRDAMRLAGASEQGISNADLDRLRRPLLWAWLGAAILGGWMAISLIFQIGGPAS